ncbi:MAG: S4 domain-containing protein [Flavonifractor plautii]
MERLDKILANTGRWSRKEARELVRAGRVAVDGVTAQAADGYDLAARFGGRRNGFRGAAGYLMLHKPAGLVSATEDPPPAACWSCCQHLRGGAFPAGRLDKDPRACSCHQ